MAQSLSPATEKFHPLHRCFEGDPWKFDFDARALLDKYRAERDRRLREDATAQFVTLGEGKGKKWVERRGFSKGIS